MLQSFRLGTNVRNEVVKHRLKKLTLLLVGKSL